MRPRHSRSSSSLGSMVTSRTTRGRDRPGPAPCRTGRRRRARRPRARRHPGAAHLPDLVHDLQRSIHDRVVELHVLAGSLREVPAVQDRLDERHVADRLLRHRAVHDVALPGLGRGPGLGVLGERAVQVVAPLLADVVAARAPRVLGIHRLRGADAAHGLHRAEHVVGDGAYVEVGARRGRAHLVGRRRLDDRLESGDDAVQVFAGGHRWPFVGVTTVVTLPSPRHQHRLCLRRTSNRAALGVGQLGLGHDRRTPLVDQPPRRRDGALAQRRAGRPCSRRSWRCPRPRGG